MLEGTHSIFSDEGGKDIDERLLQGDIHCTGPLYGKKSKLACGGKAAELEKQVLASYEPLLAGLEKQGLSGERRALRLIPKALAYRYIESDCIEISFELPSGCFATAVLAELVQYRSMDR